ncbi:MAG: hypothetical protein EZS28_034115, partial [Streblomastix strix]
MIIRQWFT